MLILLQSLRLQNKKRISRSKASKMSKFNRKRHLEFPRQSPSQDCQKTKIKLNLELKKLKLHNLRSHLSKSKRQVGELLLQLAIQRHVKKSAKLIEHELIILNINLKKNV